MITTYPEQHGFVGLVNPETLCKTFGATKFDEEFSQSVTSAFPTDLLLTFAAESVTNGDEWRVRSDRFGRCLTQSEIIRVYRYA